MDRSREARKISMAAPASLARRKHRGSGLRDSPDEDGTMELQEPARLRDRKKERERDRERDRFSRNKRRRGDRLIHAGNREHGPDESTDESVNDDEEEDYEDDEGGGGGGISRMLPPNPASTSSPSLSNHHSNHHRRSFLQSVPSTKTFRPASPWKPADEMIGVPVPRKARSASTKRAHDCWASASGGIIGGDQLHRQASTSPARSSLASATASPSRISPPSSNISIRKKMKHIGTKKHRVTPKASTSKEVSSNQDEIEFEIAEVLYGMMKQPPGLTKPEGGANEALDKSASDSKSRVSSPVSSAAPHQSSASLAQNAGSYAIVATVPKRKRPRPVNYGDENVGLASQGNFIPKIEAEQVVKGETLSKEKNFKPVLANEGVSSDLEQSRDESVLKPDVTNLVNITSPESDTTRPEPVVALLKDEDGISAERDTHDKTFDENLEDNNGRQSTSGLGIKREDKFQIDLMAPPPASRLSPGRDGNILNVLPEQKKSLPDVDEVVKDVEKNKAVADSRNLVESDHKRFKRGSEELELQKASFSKERSFKLQLNTREKNDGEKAGANRQEVQIRHQHAQPYQSRCPAADDSTGDKTLPSASSLPSALSIPGWQGGLPPFGYMTPLGGVVSMDGNTLPSTPLQPPQMLLNQPRPKRCATHCYIARSISYHQQLTKMNTFWPAGAGSAATLYGANTCNLNVIPSVEMHGVRGVNPVLDKSPSVFSASNTSKDKPSQGPNLGETAQRKQIQPPQSIQSGAPINLLQGPAFIFPLNQQQAAVAMKNSSVAGASPTGNPTSESGSSLSAAPATMSFNYPNIAANETQYLAILQNNPYQFHFPSHPSAPTVYRGAHPQAMPFFNGTFYPPQVLHPSHLQQQPQQSSHGHQIPPGQNMGISSGSSSSQKHLHNQPQKSQGNGSGAGTSNMKYSFPSPKNRPSHLHLKPHNQHLTETGNEDSPSTADSRGSHSNFGGGGTGGIINGNHNQKKQQQPHQGLKGVESIPSHQGFAVSFASLNGGVGPPTLDITSMGQNHSFLQNVPDAARHNYQALSAPQAHQKQNFRFADELSKGSPLNKGSGIDASIIDEERKSMVGKGASSTVGLSIAFSRSDLADSVPGNSVVDSSSRNLRVGSGSGKTSGPIPSTSMNNGNSLNTQQQQLQHYQQQQHKAQMLQLHPQQYMVPGNRGKTPSMSNGHVFSDNLPTNVSMGAKLNNSVTTFHQNHGHIGGGNNSPTQSQQWKSSARTSISQVSAPSSAPANSASVKNHYQQQSQPLQQSHMQISFGGSKPNLLSTAHGQQLPTGQQSPQMVVGSPPASSSYKSSGSPRTTTSGMVTSKAPQASSLSPSAALQVRNPSMPSRSSSPVGARNVLSVLGNSNMGMPQGNSKTQMFQSHQLQHQQQMKAQLSKQPTQQAQALFPSHLQTSQGPHSTSSTTTSPAVANTSYLQRRKPEAQSQQQSQSSPRSSSTGMLSMCSSTVAAISDPAKAIAAAAAAGNNSKAPPHITSNAGVTRPSG